MDLSHYINKIYFQFTSSLTQLVIVHHAVKTNLHKYHYIFTNQCFGVLLFFSCVNMASGSTALHIATLVLLFIAHIRFPASNSITSILRKRYGCDLNTGENFFKKNRDSLHATLNSH